MSKGLIEMQQALSEKFGIPTFDLKGQVSTIPKTRPLNTDINVNTGATGLSVSAFNQLLQKFTPTKATVSTHTVYSPQTGYTTQPVTSVLTPSEVVIPESNTGSSIFSNIAPYSGYLVLGAVALLALTLLKRA